MSEGHFVQDEYYDELLADFLDESSRLLDVLNDHLLRLDELVAQHGSVSKELCGADAINEMFRAAHSIKGLSAMLGLSEINTLTHRVENIFDAARRGNLNFTEEIMELLFSSYDTLVGLIRKLEDPQTDAPNPIQLINHIQQLLQSIETSTLMPADDQTPPETNADAHSSAELDPHTATESSSQESMSTVPVQSPSSADPFAGVQDDAQVPAKYLSIFIDEAEETLEQMNEALLALENGQEEEAIKTLLVNAHRFKGSAASIGLHRASKLAHMMEELLQKISQKQILPTPERIEALFSGTDALENYVEGLRQGQNRTDTFHEVAQRILATVNEETQTSAQDSEQSQSESSTPENSERLFAEHLVRIRAKVGEHDRGFMGQVTLDPKFPLKDLKAQLVVEKLHRLGRLIYCDPPADQIEGNEKLHDVFFAVLTEIEQSDLEKQLNIVGVIRVRIEPFGNEESESKSTSEPASHTANVHQEAQATSSSKQARNQSTPHKERKGATSPARAPKPSETLRVDIERLDQLMNLTGQLVITKARFTQLCDQIRAASRSGRTDLLLKDTLESLRKIQNTALDSSSEKTQVTLETLRTHVLRIENNLQALQDKLSQLNRLSLLANDLSEVAHQMDRISQGLQKTAMDTRMVPIGPLFSRFRRIIRDITRLTGKDIRLEIRGEKTELDKRMIDELADPLIHLVRNAADHGIEPPEERQAAGKPPWGTITLNAFHRGSSIVIQVSDDGRGLNTKRILEKALERKIITPSEAEQLTPQQIHQLIWKPGFSTAEQVTEISGRGVGMDIVRSKIEAINGSVEVESHPGQGTTFSIRLPLTLAILPSLLVRIHGEVFAIPLESVDEIVMLGPSQLSTVQGALVADVRGRCVSVVHLDQLFHWNDGPRMPKQLEPPLTVVLLRCDGSEVGLCVDRVLGEEDVVIKSLADNYRNIPGIAGASILGDGRVGLILDVAAAVHGASELKNPHLQGATL